MNYHGPAPPPPPPPPQWRANGGSGETVSPVSVASPLDQKRWEKQDEDLKIPPTTSSSAIYSDLKDSPGAEEWKNFKPVPCSQGGTKLFGHAVLDLLQIILVIPFLVLGVATIAYDGRSINDVIWTRDIVAAAQYGPTFFPILFSLIIGRFMKAIAYYRLERRATIQTMEQLHGSRTVVSAFITQFKLHSYNLLALGIVLLWSLSPVGSQASLRSASLVRRYENVGFNLSYLDVVNRYSPADNGFSTQLPGSMMTSSLMTPARTRTDDAWDAWGNVRIPLIEDLEGSNPGMGWISTQDRNVTYASLIGIPMTVNSTIDAVEGMTVSFTLDTSYWWLDCNTSIVNNASSYQFPATVMSFSSAENTTKVGMSTILRQLPVNDVSEFPFNETTAQKMGRFFRGEPRSVYFITQNSAPTGTLVRDVPGFAATCNLTTTFVEVNTTCSGAYSSQFASTVVAPQRCRATAVRRSRFNRTESNISVLDVIGVDRDTTFLRNFLDSTTLSSTRTTLPRLAANIGYLANPANPFTFSSLSPDWRNVTERQFGTRLARMLNTYWVASVGYKPVQGDFDRAVFGEGGLNGGSGRLRPDAGNASIPRDGLQADRKWTAVLLTASVVMLMAAAATLVLDMVRRAPGGMENFSNVVRDSPHAHVVVGGQKWPLTLSSVLEGYDRARLLRNVVVQVGDVAPTAPHGYVAIGTPDTVAIERLKKGRTYL